MPALNVLFDIDWEDLGKYNDVWFDTSIRKFHHEVPVWIWELFCRSSGNCQIKYSRSYTPTMNAIIQKVMFKGHKISFSINRGSVDNWRVKGNFRGERGN